MVSCVARYLIESALARPDHILIVTCGERDGQWNCGDVKFEAVWDSRGLADPGAVSIDSHLMGRPVGSAGRSGQGGDVRPDRFVETLSKPGGIGCGDRDGFGLGEIRDCGGMEAERLPTIGAMGLGLGSLAGTALGDEMERAKRHDMFAFRAVGFVIGACAADRLMARGDRIADASARAIQRPQNPNFHAGGRSGDRAEIVFRQADTQGQAAIAVSDGDRRWYSGHGSRPLIQVADRARSRLQPGAGCFCRVDARHY